jgi:LysM repeat protein
MAARSPARWLAPLALVTVAVAVYAVVSTGINQESGGTVEHPATTSGDRRPAPPKERAVSHARIYVVRPGDTLSGISARTGVPLATLTRLNEDLDTQALQTGQRVKLRP